MWRHVGGVKRRSMRTCAGGRVVSDGVCDTSSELVRTVNADGVPTWCGDGFFFNENTCETCGETCATRLDAATCLSCGDGII